MSGKLVGQVLKLKLSRSQREVLIVMAEACRKDDGNGVSIKVPVIAHILECSERQVQRVQAQLKTMGVLVALETPSNKPVVWKIEVSKAPQIGKYAPKQKQARGDISQGESVGVTPDVGVTSLPSEKEARGDITSREGQGSNRITVKDKKQERARESQFWDNVPKQECVEICHEWATNLPTYPINPYSPKNLTTAAEMWKAGYRAHQVGLCVKAKMADDWWIGKTLTLAKVAELLPDYLLSLKPKKPNVPPEVINAGKTITPIYWGTDFFKREPLEVNNG